MNSDTRAGLLPSILDLLLPRECGGCEAAGTLWCERCATDLNQPPIEIRPRVDPGVPCWAVGRYSGSRRGAVLALKERNRHDLAEPLGRAVAAAVTFLRLHGHIDPPELGDLVLVPAPTRARAARARGGDSVERFAVAASSALAPEPVAVSRVLRMRKGVRDSVGLSASDRAANVAGRIAVSASRRSRVGHDPSLRSRRHGSTVLLIDDVLTTGATAHESVCALGDSGIHVDGVLVIAAV